MFDTVEGLPRSPPTSLTLFSLHYGVINLFFNSFITLSFNVSKPAEHVLLSDKAEKEEQILFDTKSSIMYNVYTHIRTLFQ